uniref:Uncharacterized protein n=1 Tax=Mesocestoides corti TaxID=53468 RepID=A0A5K3FW43_MESCO
MNDNSTQIFLSPRLLALNSHKVPGPFHFHLQTHLPGRQIGHSLLRYHLLTATSQ